MVRDSRGGHNRKIIDEDFFKTWKPAMAYVLGFMYADGSLLNTNLSSRTYYLLFSNNDLCLLESIRNTLKSDHIIYVRQPHIMDYKGQKYISKTGYILRIGNKVMYQDLVNIGMQHKKSKIMNLPKIPIKYFPYYLRGYFDGDGCINWHLLKGRNYPSLRVIFTSGSINFLTSLMIKISEMFNLPIGQIQKSDGAFNLIYQGSNAFMILKYMYSNLNAVPYLKYKYEKYLNFQNNLMGPRVKKSLGIN